MGATTYSKANKWNEAVQQYDELLPLLAKTKGINCKEYNSVSIHKAALLVKTGGHDHALTIIIKYFGVAEKSAERIVDDSDHILAMDIYTSLLLYIGDVDKAKHVFEEKLAFLDRLPKTDDMKSDTMHKLGCLLAFKNEPQLALPLLNEALDSRKRLFDGRHKAVFESTWAVATTAQSLGDTDRSLKEYSVLVDKKNISRDLPVDIIRILNSAGKLFLGDGNTDKSVASFRQALHEAETRRNDEQKHVAELNLANALSAKGKSDEAMVLYEKIVRKKELKLSKIFFLALVNKSLLLLKLGQTEEAHKILRKIEATHSASADDVRGTVYLLLGNVAMLNGEFDKAIGYFEDSLDVADDDVNSLVQAKKCISLAHVSSGQYDKAISTLDDLLEDLSGQSAECKSTNLSKAEIWNFMSRVYKKQGNLPQAKNFAKLGKHLFRLLSSSS
jgi:tetratricopeptide (TPR) repeat protein